AAFEELGATGWAERAGDALRASGATPAGPVVRRTAALAPQELQIARLVAHGHSNREVAARLFLSPRTVEAEVRAIFAKLGVSSRVELAECGFATDHSGELLRSRLARAGLAELFRDLRDLRGPALQDALAGTLGDPELVDARRSAAAIAVEHAQRHTQSQQRLSELRAARQRIVEAGDAERRR